MKTLVEAVLAAWRESERIAADHPAGSREHDVALAAAEHLRQAYALVTASSPAADDTTTSVEESSTLLASWGTPEEAA